MVVGSRGERTGWSGHDVLSLLWIECIVSRLNLEVVREHTCSKLRGQEDTRTQKKRLLVGTKGGGGFLFV